MLGSTFDLNAFNGQAELFEDKHSGVRATMKPEGQSGDSEGSKGQPNTFAGQPTTSIGRREGS